MIHVDFVVVGKSPPGKGDGLDTSTSGRGKVSFILESAWESRELLEHFFGLLGSKGIPGKSQYLDGRHFDVEGLKRMALICGDYAEVITQLLAFHEAKFNVYLAGHLIRRNSCGSSPSDVVVPPGTLCKSGPLEGQVSAS